MLLRAIGFLTLLATALTAQTYRDRMGVDIDAPGDGSRSRQFVNHARMFRPCSLPDFSKQAPDDSDGWPTVDSSCVMFDIRPIPAWAPPIDDPAQFQPDWSGTWSLSFAGRADVSIVDGQAAVNNLLYDPVSNITTADVVVVKNSGLLILGFRNSRRALSSATGTGFRELRLVRPGYPAASQQFFTDEFLRSFTPFRILRYMDWTGTNSSTPSNNPTDLLQWSDRRLVRDATQQSTGRTVGAAWEFVALLANQTGTDVWINIPVAASDDYIRQLARLLNAKLNRSLRVYIEHGNEVWNPLFANSYNFNRNAALAEVAAGGSKLNSDGTTNLDNLGVRYHLRRITEAVAIFRQEMEEDAASPRIRGVFAWWTIFPDRYTGALNWYKANYGDPRALLYGMAGTHYYNAGKAAATATPDQLLAAMQKSSDAGIGYDNLLRTTARDFGLTQILYEGGPDVGGGSTVNVGNRILANRLPAMKDLVIRDMKSNFFDLGGSEYVYFSHCGSCSRYGCWGATEDIVDATAPKWTALAQLAAGPSAPALPPLTSIENAATGGVEIAAGSFVTLRGDNLATGTWDWNQAMLDGSPALPTMLGGVQVRVAGRDAAVEYAARDQVNVVLPADVPAGAAPVEVFTRNGIFRGTVNVRTAAPGLFAYDLGAVRYAAALIAGSATYVAPVGSLSGSGSRPALAGDYVSLYATGLGATLASYPANENLTRPYPVADLSMVQVRLGGIPTAVTFAGLVSAGLYQIDVRIPEGIGAGDRTVELIVNGAASRPAALALGEPGSSTQGTPAQGGRSLVARPGDHWRGGLAGFLIELRGLAGKQTTPNRSRERK